MANDNETVEQVAKDLCKYLYCPDGILYSLTGKEAIEYKDRLLAAHNREMAGIIANLEALEKAIAVVCDKATVDKIIAKKKDAKKEGVAKCSTITRR